MEKKIFEDCTKKEQLWSDEKGLELNLNLDILLMQSLERVDDINQEVVQKEDNSGM